MDISKKLIRVKRKANEDSNLTVSNKRFKYLGRILSVQDEDAEIRELLMDTMKSPDCEDKKEVKVNYKITDYEDFMRDVPDDQRKGFPQLKDTITCNGRAMEVVDANVGLDGYVYDIFLYEGELMPGEDPDDYEDGMPGNGYREVGDEEECDDEDDEHYRYNDYPDENEVDQEECDYYRDYEDEDEIQMRKRFERLSKLSGEEDYDVSDDDEDDLSPFDSYKKKVANRTQDSDRDLDDEEEEEEEDDVKMKV